MNVGECMRLIVSCLVLVAFSDCVYARSVQNVLPSQQQVIVQDNSYKELIFERVIDGDTFIASGIKIRLWGIDAPERGETMYAISSKVLELFLESGKLECKQINTDRYNRSIMHCYSGNSDLGATMVKAGFARDYKKYSGGFYQLEQSFAREGRLGLWE